MKGMRCAIRPEMKATSRDSRSSLATMIGHLAGVLLQVLRRAAAGDRARLLPCRSQSP